MDQATDSLARWRHNIYLIPQLIQNDVSSTKVSAIICIRSHSLITLFHIGSTIHSSGAVSAVLVANAGCQLHRTAWALRGGRHSVGQGQGA